MLSFKRTLIEQGTRLARGDVNPCPFFDHVPNFDDPHPQRASSSGRENGRQVGQEPSDPSHPEGATMLTISRVRQ